MANRNKVERSLKFESEVICQMCEYKHPTTIQNHIRFKHPETTCKEYMEKYDAEITSEELKRKRKEKSSVKRRPLTQEEKDLKSQKNKDFWADNEDKRKEVGERIHNLALEGKHPSQTKEFKEKASERMIERNKSDEQIQIVKDAMTGREFSQEWKDAISQGSIGKVLTKEHKKHMSETHKKNIASGKRKTAGKYIGKFWSNKNQQEIYYRSELELMYMKQLEIENYVKEYTCDKVRIPYLLDNEKYTYLPDFLINNKLLVEINSYNVFYLNKRKKEAKVLAAREYCKERGWKFKVLYEDDFGVEYSVPDYVKRYKFPRK